MAKYIDQSDLKNKELQMLPIRRGCSGMCACLGICRDIEGYIDRKEYEDFMKNFVTLDQFLTEKCISKKTL